MEFIVKALDYRPRYYNIYSVNGSAALKQQHR
jgi:hypothetical protein